MCGQSCAESVGFCIAGGRFCHTFHLFVWHVDGGHGGRELDVVDEEARVKKRAPIMRDSVQAQPFREGFERYRCVFAHLLRRVMPRLARLHGR